MITEKDVEEGEKIIAAWEIPKSSISAHDAVHREVSRIRAESAEQARKEAAWRVKSEKVKPGAFANRDLEDGWNAAINAVETAILGDSSATITDGEKLAIAVKALNAVLDDADDMYARVGNALKDIQK